MDNQPILTIAIPTIESRRNAFHLLYYHIKNQINEFGLRKEVELVSICDNKEISIGAKRQKLFEKAKGKYIVMIDDDDWVPYSFVQKVLEACKQGNDCVGYMEECNFANFKKKKSLISLRVKEWADNVGMFDYVRTPFFKVPIKTDICRQVGCKDMRFGEDHDFAIRIKPLLKTETFIKEYMYIYRHKEEPHNAKYGIK
jgi:glycosyltransferase involved in cell wall biosynthesis